MEFAARWGALGSEGTCCILLLNEDGSEQYPHAVAWGESIEIWVHEIASMRSAVAFWDAARHEQHKLLEACIKIDGDCVSWSSVPILRSSFISITDTGFRPERLAQIRQHGLVRAAHYIVQDLINEGLRARVHEQLRWNADLERLAIQIVPINLIGAMWLQFATAVEGGHEYGQCEVCKNWFEVTPGSGRPDKRYCSDACRMRAYRKRKAAKNDALVNRKE